MDVKFTKHVTVAQYADIDAVEGILGVFLADFVVGGLVCHGGVEVLARIEADRPQGDGHKCKNNHTEVHESIKKPTAMHHVPTLHDFVEVGGQPTNQDQQTWNQDETNNSLKHVHAHAEVVIEKLGGESVHFCFEYLQLPQVHSEGILRGNRVGLDNGSGLDHSLSRLLNLIGLFGFDFSRP